MLIKDSNSLYFLQNARIDFQTFFCLSRLESHFLCTTSYLEKGANNLSSWYIYKPTTTTTTTTVLDPYTVRKNIISNTSVYQFVTVHVLHTYKMLCYKLKWVSQSFQCDAQTI